MTEREERWEPSYDEVVRLTAWMASHGYSASDVAYAVEKPWKHADCWERVLTDEAFENIRYRLEQEGT
jgi:hypothetical protein